MLPAIQSYAATKADEITALFDNAIIAGFREAHRSFHRAHSTSGAPTEPDYVRGIFAVGIPFLNHGLPRVFRGTGISVRTSGVFCHQSPIVKLAGVSTRKGDSCELGDLLFVFVFRHGKNIKRNALLLQTKLDRKGRFDPGDVKLEDDGPQYALYNQWPEFDYVKGLKGSRRVSGGYHKGAQFAIFSYSNCLYYCRPFWLHAHSSMAINRGFSNPLSDELFDVLMGNSGRYFADKATAANGIDWDRVVWDLLSSTAQRLCNLKSSRIHNIPRGSEYAISGAIEPPEVMKLVYEGDEEELKAVWEDRNDTLPPDAPPGERPPLSPDDKPGISAAFFDFTIDEESV